LVKPNPLEKLQLELWVWPRNKSAKSLRKKMKLKGEYHLDMHVYIKGINLLQIFWSKESTGILSSSWECLQHHEYQKDRIFGHMKYYIIKSCMFLHISFCKAIFDQEITQILEHPLCLSYLSLCGFFMFLELFLKGSNFRSLKDIQSNVMKVLEGLPEKYI
jgi:hypothetical protein